MSENTHQKTINQVYAVLVVSLAFSMAPVFVLQGFGALLFLASFIALYVYRAKAEAGDLVHNHMTFLIRTLWIGSLLMACGIVAAATLADHSPMTQFIDSIMKGAVPTQDDMHVMANNYLHTNLTVFALTIGPSLVYTIYRIGKGLARALKGYRMPDPKGWF